MFNLNNVNGYLSANNFISIVGNRYGSEYTADALNFQVGLLNGGLKAQLGPSYSLSVGADLQIGILSGLTESILAVDASPLTLADNSSYYVKGLADICNVNGGNGVSGLTNDAFKKKLEIPTTKDKAITVNGKEEIVRSGGSTSESTSTPHNLYSRNDLLKTHFADDINAIVRSAAAIVEDTVEGETRTNSSIDGFKSAVEGTALFNKAFVDKVSMAPLNRAKFAELKTKINALSNKQDYDKIVSGDLLSDSWKNALENLLTFNKDSVTECAFVKEVTTKGFDAGATTGTSSTGGATTGTSSTGGGTTVNDVILKVYNGGGDISMSSLVSGNPRDLKFLKVESDAAETEINEEKFFSYINDDKIKFHGQSRAIYFIGLFGDRKSTVTRSVSVAFIPQFEVAGTYTAFSVQGISFDAVGLSIKTPLLSLISEGVNNWTFSLVQPFAANVQKGQKTTGVAFEEFSKQILTVNNDKSIADEVLSKTSDDAFKKEINNNCIKPFASEDENQWFIKNNYSGSVFAKLNNPLFNLLTAVQINVQAKGKHYLCGLSFATVYSFIKIV